MKIERDSKTILQQVLGVLCFLITYVTIYLEGLLILHSVTTWTVEDPSDPANEDKEETEKKPVAGTWSEKLPCVTYNFFANFTLSAIFMTYCSFHKYVEALCFVTTQMNISIIHQMALQRHQWRNLNQVLEAYELLSVFKITYPSSSVFITF